MRRPWMVAAAGIVLVGSATILGLVLFRKNGFFELTLPELTLWSIVVGTMTVAFLGILFVEMKAPSVKRRTRLFLFGLFGAVCGLIASVVYGVFSIKEVCIGGGIDYDYCGWSVMGLVLRSFWPSLGLLAAVVDPGSRGRRDSCLAHARHPGPDDCSARGLTDDGLTGARAAARRPKPRRPGGVTRRYLRWLRRGCSRG